MEIFVPETNDSQQLTVVIKDFSLDGKDALDPVIDFKSGFKQT